MADSHMVRGYCRHCMVSQAGLYSQGSREGGSSISCEAQKIRGSENDTSAGRRGAGGGGGGGGS